MNNKCDQVFVASLGHNVQFGFGCVVGHKMLFWWPLSVFVGSHMPLHIFKKCMPPKGT